MVEFFSKKVSRRYEIKMQVIGEDADFEKSGRILNRVVQRDRDGTTIEADQRDVREILKDLELERANHSTTPCAVERKDEGGARKEESKGRTDTDRDRLGSNKSGTTSMMVTTGTDSRWQMTMPTTARHSQVVTSRGAEHLLYESATSHKIDQMSSSHQLRYVVRWQVHLCVTWSE